MNVTGFADAEVDWADLVETLGVPVVTPLPETAEDLMQKYGVTAEQAGDGSLPT